MKEAKKKQITKQICEQARLMRKGGANQTEIGNLLGVNPCTISRIEKAGFNLEEYQRQLKERRAKEKKQAEEPKAAEEQQAAEELPGQLEMELPPVTEKLSEQVKMMRFQAGQVEKIIGQMMVNVDALLMKMDRMNDTMGQILRAVRKE